MLTFNTDGMVTQRFPFKSSIMDYVFKHLKPEHLIKLYKCSKYFYAKFRRNIIRHLELVPFVREETLDPTRTVISASNRVLSTFKDCWITDSFIARDNSWIRLPEFNHCNIKKLELRHCILWKEYVILTKSGTVEELISLGLVLMAPNGFASASVDHLLGQVPNAKSVEICLAGFSETSCASLLSVKRDTKFSRFVINIFRIRFLNIDMFTEFIVKNTENDCHVHVAFANIFTLQFYSAMDVSNITLHSSSTFDPPIYTFKQPYRQQFSLPFDVIKYMIKNCKSGKLWKKVIMTCKHFYPKNPVFPVEVLKVNANFKCEADEELFNVFKFFPKLWLYDTLSAQIGSNLSTLITKIYKFNLLHLEVYCQNLTMADYQKLTSSGPVETLFLWQCNIKNEDDSNVTADRLLEGLSSNLESFAIDQSDNLFMLQTETVKKIVQHLNGYTKMSVFQLCGINESFDFASFSDFLLKNETVTVYLAYGSHLSDTYKENTVNVVKEIMKNPSLKVPKLFN
uniref:F-box domain-containing protein n=1 Tax=Panagrolaimus davidi TaxID=227884 RepID=A0A914QTF1_9BILA